MNWLPENQILQYYCAVCATAVNCGMQTNYFPYLHWQFKDIYCILYCSARATVLYTLTWSLPNISLNLKFYGIYFKSFRTQYKVKNKSYHI